jgi:hypothetical protein
MEMLHKLIIVADLQHLKIFISKIDLVGCESLELQENKGRFRKDNSIIEKEEYYRIREMVEEISYFLQKYKNEKWCFAAPKTINEQIVGLLDASIKDNMAVNLCLEVLSDLSLLPSSKYL